MVRNIPYVNTRKPASTALNTDPDPVDERRHVRRVTDDLRTDLAQVSSTAPDMRDRVTFKSNGEIRQRVAHGKDFIPDVIAVRVVVTDDDDNEVYNANEYRDADSRFLYIKTRAPKGAKISVLLHPRD